MSMKGLWSFLEFTPSKWFITFSQSGGCLQLLQSWRGPFSFVFPLITVILTLPNWTTRSWFFPAVLYFFYVQMTTWQELCEIFKLGNYFIISPSYKRFQNFICGPSAVLLGLLDAVCSLMFSKKPLRLSQNSWSSTEIRLHTVDVWRQTGCTGFQLGYQNKGSLIQTHATL